jgi:hypothetical protein
MQLLDLSFKLLVFFLQIIIVELFTKVLLMLQVTLLSWFYVLLSTTFNKAVINVQVEIFDFFLEFSHTILIGQNILLLSFTFLMSFNLIKSIVRL